jgi:hypothetical protein
MRHQHRQDHLVIYAALAALNPRAAAVTPRSCGAPPDLLKADLHLHQTTCPASNAD